MAFGVNKVWRMGTVHTVVIHALFGATATLQHNIPMLIQKSMLNNPNLGIHAVVSRVLPYGILACILTYK